MPVSLFTSPRRPLLLVAPLVAAFAFLAGPSTANASLTVDIVVTDLSNLETDSFSLGLTGAGFYSFLETALTNFDVSVDGFGRDGNLGTAILQSQSISIASLWSGSPTTRDLEVLVSVTGYTLPGDAGNDLIMSTTSEGSSTIYDEGQVVTLSSYADAADTVFGTGFALGDHDGVLEATGAGTRDYVFTPDTRMGLFDRGAGSYSVTHRYLVTLSSGKDANLTLVTNLTAVPEPANLAMGLLGAGLLALIGRRRLLRLA